MRISFAESAIAVSGVRLGRSTFGSDNVAAGKPDTPPPISPKKKEMDESTAETKNDKPKPNMPRSAAASSSAKRKLVGGAETLTESKEGDKDDGKRKKKKKADKGLLSFNETEGE